MAKLPAISRGKSTALCTSSDGPQRSVRGGVDTDAGSWKHFLRQWFSARNDVLTSVRELWARNTRKRALDELSNTVNTKELIEDKGVASASVTESTTRALDSRVRVKRSE
jgi:hypothetical protein